MHKWRGIRVSLFIQRRSRQRPVLVDARRATTPRFHARDQLLQPIPIFGRSQSSVVTHGQAHGTVLVGRLLLRALELIQPSVVQRAPRRRSTLWIMPQQLRDQRLRPTSWFFLKIFKRRLVDELQLLLRVFSRKNRPPEVHLPDHTSNGPQIDRRAPSRLQPLQQLRRAVPARRDAVVVLGIISYEVDDAPAEPACIPCLSRVVAATIAVTRSPRPVKMALSRKCSRRGDRVIRNGSKSKMRPPTSW